MFSLAGSKREAKVRVSPPPQTRASGAASMRAFAYVVDDDRRAAVAHFLAQGSGDVERVARLETEFEFVEDRAGGP